MRKCDLKLLLLLLASHLAVPVLAKANIEILATGGTIAGVAATQVATTYQAGKLTAEQLIASVPFLNQLATIKYLQVYNKDSGDITLNDWLKLATTLNLVATDSKLDGIVITHGTDTLEETAYFLDLVAKTDKPIVLVGAMRAATDISADGPLNLYNAVAVAADANSKGRGVLVVMNDKIFDARNVSKTNTTNVATFAAPNTGPLGQVVMGQVSYAYTPIRPHTSATPFSVNSSTQFPKVEIIYEYAGVDNAMLTQILNTPQLKGLVIAGMGDGNIPSYENDFLRKARKKGITIVRSSRVGSGEVSYDYNQLDSTYGLIAGDNLNPEKARILLMLSLMQTNDRKTIQKYFYTY